MEARKKHRTDYNTSKDLTAFRAMKNDIFRLIFINNITYSWNHPVLLTIARHFAKRILQVLAEDSEHPYES